MFKVLKRFMTATQVFEPGVNVTAAQIDGAIPLDHWQAQGFVEHPAPVVPPVVPAAAPAYAPPRPIEPPAAS